MMTSLIASHDSLILATTLTHTVQHHAVIIAVVSTYMYMWQSQVENEHYSVLISFI